MLDECIQKLVVSEDLAAAEMESAMEVILCGEASEAQIAAFVIALRMKGESAEEIAAAARTLKRHASAVSFSAQPPILDTCGTGGDGLDTFNISTAAAIVAAACGVRVAKHGNRAVSSRAGSADVLEALGIKLELSPERVGSVLDEVGVTFFFAPHFHSAMKHVAPVRRALKLRTIFNLIGPLANPAGATHQLVGVYDEKHCEQMAEAFGALGLERAWVVHGTPGMDEVSPCGQTKISQWNGKVVETRTLEPKDFGLDPVPLTQLQGGDADANAAIIESVLKGEDNAARRAVVINASAALCVAGRCEGPLEGAELASEAIDSGRALHTLKTWREATQRQ